MSRVEITAPSDEADVVRDRPRRGAFAARVFCVLVLASVGASTTMRLTPSVRGDEAAARFASAEVYRGDRGVGRRALSVYYNRKIAGGQQLNMRHGASTRTGLARDRREANWVGNEINRHVNLNAKPGGAEAPEVEAGSTAAEFGGIDNNVDATTSEDVLRRRRRKSRAKRKSESESEMNENQMILATPAVQDNDDAMQSARETLGVSEGATRKEITKAFYKQARLHHTDKVGPAGKEKMQEINAAKELLLSASDSDDAE